MKDDYSISHKMLDINAIKQAKELVFKSKKITALTGAGISVDSGIPDFRSEGGLWERYDPHEYATIESFMQNPTKFWTMGRELAETILKAEPNNAHKGLVKLEKDGKLIGIITQNIDNLHQAAGSERVVELHGNYLRAYCIECNAEYVGETVHESVVNGEIPPRCEKCNGVLKSEAILFGEPLPEAAMSKAAELCRTTDLMLVIGTSLTIYPAAFLPQLAKNSGAKIILVSLEGINRDSVADIVIRGRATEVIPKIVDY
ncbi:MAG: NAD-dependent deacetylase [Promethearchaeota archaeon]